MLITVSRRIGNESRRHEIAGLNRRRENAFLDERSAEGDAIREVDGKNIDRDSAHVRLSDKRRSIPHEVLIPPIKTRIEETNVASFQKSRDVRSLV